LHHIELGWSQRVGETAGAGGECSRKKKSENDTTSQQRIEHATQASFDVMQMDRSHGSCVFTTRMALCMVHDPGMSSIKVHLCFFLRVIMDESCLD